MSMECPGKKDDEQKKDGMAGYLLKTRTIVLSGEVDQELAERVISQLFVLDNESHEPIRVVITSQGGHVDSGYAIHDVMRYVESPVYSIGAGWVASIAVPILFGAKKKENRLALPNTRFLLHQPSGGAGGQLQDIRIEAQEIMRIRQRINKLISDETGQSLDKVAKDSDRNFWMSAEEAVKYGIISRIINSAKEIAK
ncbi:MAG: ATP-dependent Clp protease proteolytic subunit [Candidatus Hydrogenedentes bacterium]|nr:ATP-dependent Clp protease proteolytic subunit [Candidatus Hydrogenedentota bacterium]